METALTIAGSDSGGGAGIQADIKTFDAFGVFGTSVITAITSQNTVGVQDIFPVPASAVKSQMSAILEDFHITAAKTGMLFNREIIEAVCKGLAGKKFPLVVDPVMVSTSGDLLLQNDAIEYMQENLFPLATMVTPNKAEAEVLSGSKISSWEDLYKVAIELSLKYPGKYFLVKGGHMMEENQGKEMAVTDVLAFNGKGEMISGPWIDTPNTHGTGCTLSAAIVANLVKGQNPSQAVSAAKRYVTDAISFSWANLGSGKGALRHNFTKLKSMVL